MKNLLSKKGQVQTLAPAILALIFAAIVLVMGLVITQSIRDTDIVGTDIGASGTEWNESIDSIHGLTSTLNASAKFPNGGCSAVVSIFNGTAGVRILETGNWSLSECILTNTSSTYSESPSVRWVVSYNYTRAGEAYVSGNKTVAGLATFADFWEIIVLAIVITVVVGLLLIIFGGRTRR